MSPFLHGIAISTELPSVAQVRPLAAYSARKYMTEGCMAIFKFTGKPLLPKNSEAYLFWKALPKQPSIALKSSSQAAFRGTQRHSKVPWFSPSSIKVVAKPLKPFTGI
eukprot:1158002-Pelagomonas_calceolata.AAC.3